MYVTLQKLSSSGFLGVLVYTSISDISLRVLVTSLSFPGGVLYIVPLFDSVLMLSHGCSSEVTLLESNYISSCVSHRLSPQAFGMFFFQMIHLLHIEI